MVTASEWKALTRIQPDQTFVQDPLRPVIADGAHEDLQHDCPEYCQTSVKDAVEHANFGFCFERKKDFCPLFG